MDLSPPDNTKQKALASFIVILSVVIVMGGVSAYEKNQKVTKATTTISTSNPAPSTPSTSTTTTQSSSSVAFKDGTFSAASDYYVPHGSENIKVTITLKGGVVTDSQIVNSENDPESARFQENFAQEYKTYVVGKKINDLHLSYVAGASDTTDGFNTALQTITQQAQA